MTGRQLPIGEFSRRSRLPVSTLRYYHEIGVLIPSKVDGSSGYRYYDASQLEPAALVAELRRLGMPPPEIARITSGSVPLTEGLDTQRRRLVAEVDDLTGKMRLIDELLAATAEQRPHRVELETRTSRIVSGISGKVDSGSVRSGIRRLVVTLRSRLREAGLADPPWYGGRFSLDLDADPVEVAVFAGYAGHPEASGPTVELPGGDHAVTGHEGRRNLTAAYEAVLDWAVEHERQPNGALIEEYRPGDVTTVAIDLRTVT